MASMKRGGIGTGSDQPSTVKAEGPGLGRVFLNGMFLAAGWMTAAAIKDAIFKKRDPEEDIPYDTED